MQKNNCRFPIYFIKSAALLFLVGLIYLIVIVCIINSVLIKHLSKNFNNYEWLSQTILANGLKVVNDVEWLLIGQEILNGE